MRCIIEYKNKLCGKIFSKKNIKKLCVMAILNNYKNTKIYENFSSKSSTFML